MLSSPLPGQRWTTPTRRRTDIRPTRPTISSLTVTLEPREIDTDHRRPLCRVQLGAALSPAGRRRGASEQQPALRRGAEMVPSGLRPDQHRPHRSGAAALLDVVRLQRHRSGRQHPIAARPPRFHRPHPGGGQAGGDLGLRRDHEAALRSVRRRAQPAERVPVVCRDEISRQSDCLGRQPVPAGHHRDHQRGHAVLRARRESARREAADHAAARPEERAQLPAAQAGRAGCDVQRADRPGGAVPVQPHSHAEPAGTAWT